MLYILFGIIALALLPFAIAVACSLLYILVFRLWPLWVAFGAFVIWANWGAIA